MTGISTACFRVLFGAVPGFAPLLLSELWLGENFAACGLPCPDREVLGKVAIYAETRGLLTMVFKSKNSFIH